MALPEKCNHRITTKEAANYIQSALQDNYSNGIKGGFFWGEQVKELLSQEGCAGLRYYFAKGDDGKATIVLKGVNNNGKDMDTIILEKARPCPPFCD